VKVARERIASTLPLDESAMATMADKRSAPRVAFGLLVESGMCRPARCSRTPSGASVPASADGSIECNGHSGSIHKVGAALAGRSVVQWLDLLANRSKTGLQPLDSLRQQYPA
jgi:modification methylase